MKQTIAISLADLIRRGSDLEAAEAERLALAWSTEIRLELEQTGISVIRGVGTLTLSAGVVRFQQDPDFPIGSELPAVEGFSEAVAASLLAASTAPKPPVNTPPTPAPRPEEPADLPPEPEAPPVWEELATVDETILDQVEESAIPVSTPYFEPEEEESDADPEQEQGAAWSEGIEAAIHQADVQLDETETPDSTSRRPSRSTRAYEPGPSGSSRWIIAVAAVVVLVVIGALLYRFVLFPGVDEPPAVVLADSSAMVPADSSVAEPDSTSQADTPQLDTGEPVLQTEQPTRPAATPAAAASNPDAGTIAPGMGGYTLIVGSTLNANSAERVRSRFTGMGLPTGVLPVTADSTTRYRIAVGLFPTAAEADTLRVRRASELPEGTWVLSVR